MPILKSTNSKLRLQLNSQYPADRVPKSIFCTPYAVNKPNNAPPEGKLSFTPTNKPSQVTSIQLNAVTLLGANLKTFYEFATEGSLTIYERANADNSVTFKISNPTSIQFGKIIQFTIADILAADAVSFFPENTQVCIALSPAPTTEAFTVVDGGYYP